MFLRRILVIGGILLILFLAMYSWNRRTRVLDDLAANIGLEVVSWVLKPVQSAESTITGFWDRYFDLVDVRDENIRLQKRIELLEVKLMSAGEDIAELKRLRELVQFPVDVRWKPLATRVLAGKIGPNSVLESITISRGYANGAKPGMPLVTNMGLLGKVLRSSAHASTVLLITDPDSRISVFGQESRAAGILKGKGSGKQLEVDFVQRASGMKKDEILVSSGLDEKYPKGLPIARVKAVAPSNYTQFLAVEAEPLVDLQHLEEVLLLEKSGVEMPPDDHDGPAPVFIGPPAPLNLIKNGTDEKKTLPVSPVTENIRKAAPPERDIPANRQMQPGFRIVTP